jgi:hypothetical protein
MRRGPWDLRDGLVSSFIMICGGTYTLLGGWWSHFLTTVLHFPNNRVDPAAVGRLFRDAHEPRMLSRLRA